MLTVLECDGYLHLEGLKGAGLDQMYGKRVLLTVPDFLDLRYEDQIQLYLPLVGRTRERHWNSSE